MLGLWKLGAMSAVIGAGVVVVWQAQQGLSPQTEPETSAVAIGDAEPGAPTAADERSSDRPVSDRTDQPPANASVPPEVDPARQAITNEFGDAPALELSAPPASASRGLDFRKLPADRETPSPSTRPRGIIEDDQWASDPRAATKPQKMTAAPALAFPEADNPIQRTAATDVPSLTIQPAGGEQSSPAEDPFAGSAPPELGAPPGSEQERCCRGRTV